MKPEKCCYPDCFHCPYDDCINDEIYEEEEVVNRLVGLDEKVLSKRKWQREYYYRNKERAKKYQEENKEKISEYRKKYYEKNKEKMKKISREVQKKKYKENPEYYREKSRRYYYQRKKKIIEEM